MQHTINSIVRIIRRIGTGLCLAYAAFVGFVLIATVVVVIGSFFSKDEESVLSCEEQKQQCYSIVNESCVGNGHLVKSLIHAACKKKQEACRQLLNTGCENE